MSINGTKLGKLAEKLIQPWPDQLYWLQHCITEDNFNLRVALFSGYPQSIYNVVVFRSAKLLASASGSTSCLISDLFSEGACCAYSFVGYNTKYGYKHLKTYSESKRLCGSFIRDARSAPDLNCHLEDDICYMSTV